MSKTKESIELNALEQMDKENLGRVAPNVNENANDVEEKLNKIGWMEVSRDDMPNKGQFYPHDWIFEIRAALTAEIRHYSTIDVNSPISITDGMNDLISSCLRIRVGNKKLSWKNLKESDRFFFVMYIRHFTMVKPHISLQFPNVCDHCGENNIVNFDWEHIQFQPLSETAIKYLDEATGLYIVKTKSYGTLNISIPSLYSGIAFRDWTIDASRRNKKFDSVFAELYWMLIASNNDGDKKIIDDAYDRYLSLNDSELGFYIQLSKKLAVLPLETIKYTCDNTKCGKEVHTQIQFPDGINHIFFAANLDSELL